ncbi:phosphoribosylanthranilate isomerase [Staphylococcus sp. IVB6181]|uniref:phosphoribosylanthranilate isomerase n=1 Tax=Staphylococcus sp. IVB6181 TaxID=2929481 RepID=UPI0021CF0822|nr:phosphoribosylanthranilate isomerase [Staphylococcus sp. IVB6181]UXV33986.1 phosphoribosylanthranilate isomerase [Staphylococcus sp. IVB6181]
MFLKYCGFQNQKDVEQAIKNDIDAIGFIHYLKSKRHQRISEIAQMTKIIPDSIHKAAVVVNPTKAIVSRLINETSIDTIQFHGHEDTALLRWCSTHYPNIQIYKALPADGKLADAIETYRLYTDLFIIDTPSIHYGGTGQTFDWNQLKQLPDVPYLVAGGMDLEKIQAFEQLGIKAAGYDIASGIEQAGQKDAQAMKTISNYIEERDKNDA